MRRLPLALVLTALACVPATSAIASPTQESSFQDDNLLEYAPPAEVAGTLDTLKALGVDRVRVSVFWAVVAPDAASQTKPKGFDGADPDAYPNGSWDRYDELVRLAQARGIAVNFDVTSPAPMWATPNPARADIDVTYAPDPKEFEAFVRAVGTRYSGSYVRPDDRQPAPGSGNGGGGGTLPPLPPPPVGGQSRAAPAQPAKPGASPVPRVDYWELWNEPNQAGWLTPQWLPDPRNAAKQVEASPAIYRGLADAGFAALNATGHGGDTILVGSTAPKGLRVRGETRSITPQRFIRNLYCLDSHLQFLRGTSAQARGCPQADQVTRFPADHPVLFRMTGWAHHPYELTFAPNRRPTDPDYVTIGNLSSLSSTLRRVFQRYGQPLRKGGMPLYLTEFGYQTNPPDRLGVSPAKQASYLDQAEYLSWRNPAVRTLSQFLLVDGGEPVGLTFQSGLRFRDNRPKPSLRSYALPIWLSRRAARRGTRIPVWGLIRSAPNGAAQTAKVQFRGRGAKRWRTLAIKHTTKRGYLSLHVRMSGTGTVRLAWGTQTSRGVAVTARR